MLLKRSLDESTTTPVTGTCTGYVCTISSFQAIAVDTKIAFTVYSVPNPSSSISGLSFVVSTQDSSSKIIEQTTILGNSSMVTGTAFTVQNLNVTEPKLIPNNAIMFGIMSFFLDPGFDLPKYSTISITFPSSFSLYVDTNTDTSCLVDGGLYSITSCTTPVSGSPVVMETGERSDGTIPITLYYVGYSTLDLPGTSITGFSISVTFNSITIATATSASIGGFTNGVDLSK